MELKELHCFEAVARHLSFSRAAQELNVAQPYVSKLIARLERDLGVKLFLRTSRLVELTPAGNVLHSRLVPILRDIDAAVDLVRNVPEGTRGTVAIGFPGSIIFNWLPAIVRRCAEMYPEVYVNIRTEMFTGEQVVALREKSLDVGLLRTPIDDLDILTQKLLDEPLIAVLPEGHRLVAGREPLDLVALKEETFITFGGSRSSTQNVILAECLACGFVPRKMRTALQTQSIVSLVSAGLGVAIVPSSIECTRLDGVVYRRMRNENLQVPLAVGWRRSDESALTRNIIDLVVNLSNSHLLASPGIVEK